MVLKGVAGDTMKVGVRACVPVWYVGVAGDTMNTCTSLPGVSYFSVVTMCYHKPMNMRV